MVDRVLAGGQDIFATHTSAPFETLIVDDMVNSSPDTQKRRMGK